MATWYKKLKNKIWELDLAVIFMAVISAGVLYLGIVGFHDASRRTGMCGSDPSVWNQPVNQAENVDAKTEQSAKTALMITAKAVPPKKLPIPKQICLSLHNWDITSVILRITLVIIGVIAISSTAVVAFLSVHQEAPQNATAIDAIENYRSKNSKNIYMKHVVLAAVAWGAIAGFDLNQLGDNIHEASMNLNVAILKYQQQEDYTMEMLISEYEQNSKYVTKVNVRNPSD